MNAKEPLQAAKRTNASDAGIILSITSLLKQTSLQNARQQQCQRFIKGISTSEEMQKSFESWLSAKVIGTIKTNEKERITACENKHGDGQLYRNMRINTEERAQLAITKLDTSVADLLTLAKEQEIYKAYFILEKFIQPALQEQQLKTSNDHNRFPRIIDLAYTEFEALFLAKEEERIEDENILQEKAKIIFSKILEKPINDILTTRDLLELIILGIDTVYGEQEPKNKAVRRFSLRGMQVSETILNILESGQYGDLLKAENYRVIENHKITPLKTMSQRRARQQGEWLAEKGWSELRDYATQGIVISAKLAIPAAIGYLALSSTFGYYQDQTTSQNAAVIEALNDADFQTMTFSNGDLGIIDNSPPNAEIPQRITTGDTCRIAKKYVNKTFRIDSIGNIYDLMDRRCPAGFLDGVLHSYYDVHSAELAEELEAVDQDEKNIDADATAIPESTENGCVAKTGCDQD